MSRTMVGGLTLESQGVCLGLPREASGIALHPRGGTRVAMDTVSLFVRSLRCLCPKPRGWL